ncbi:hypothetical protein FQ192_11855 [Pseudomonas sp. ANT_J12]|nr:hypothetical protein FQ192_11855 [Pseudomonas sp. ANT_J12]
MTNSHCITLLIELKEIFHKERCRNFDSGIYAIIRILSEDPLSDSNEWSEATSIYRTMAGTKAGFSDVYIDRDTVEQRVADNARLDTIRKVLWDTFDRS